MIQSKNENNIFKNVSKCFEYFKMEYIIKASSLPSKFTTKKEMRGHTSPPLSGADDHKLKIWK